MRLRASLLLAFLLFAPILLPAQTASLREIRAEGLKTLTQAQIASLSGLAIGSQVGRPELQQAADLLLRTGLFAKVSYTFSTHNDAVILTFKIEESLRLAVAFDNFPWYADSELNDAIRSSLPFYDGTLPEGGVVVDLAANALQDFLFAHGASTQIRHTVLANPLLDANVQQFHLEGLSPKIASVEFSDPQLKKSAAVQQHLSEIRGKLYSRLTIDLFLAEQIRPVYQQQGFLRAKIGPAEVRLSGDPNKKLPEDIPVYVPCEPGPVYHWKSAEWHGNQILSTETLNRTLGLKAGDIASGLAIEGGWERIREEYGHRGYLEPKIDPTPSFDDQAHTVAYSVSITEGPTYRFSSMNISGMSLAGERLIREAWPMQPGEVFDKTLFEDLLVRLQTHRQTIFRDLPVHYDTVGHWLETDHAQHTVTVLLDFK